MKRKRVEVTLHAQERALQRFGMDTGDIIRAFYETRALTPFEMGYVRKGHDGMHFRYHERLDCLFVYDDMRYGYSIVTLIKEHQMNQLERQRLCNHSRYFV